MSTTANANSKNILNSDVEIKGTLKFAGELTFDGKLDGDISSEGILNLGDNAVVKGNLNVNSVVLRGKINGNVTAKERSRSRPRRNCSAIFAPPDWSSRKASPLWAKAKSIPTRSPPLRRLCRAPAKRPRPPDKRNPAGLAIACTDQRCGSGRGLPHLKDSLISTFVQKLSLHLSLPGQLALEGLPDILQIAGPLLGRQAEASFLLHPSASPGVATPQSPPTAHPARKPHS